MIMIDQETKNKVDDIYNALVGNDELGVKGLVDRVEKTEKYIETDKKMKWTAAGVITALSSAISWLIND